MSKYFAYHLKRLAGVADNRFRELMRTLDTHGKDDGTAVQVDGVRVRLAVDDFKTILTEIRKLK